MNIFVLEVISTICTIIYKTSTHQSKHMSTQFLYEINFVFICEIPLYPNKFSSDSSKTQWNYVGMGIA